MIAEAKGAMELFEDGLLLSPSSLFAATSAPAAKKSSLGSPSVATVATLLLLLDAFHFGNSGCLDSSPPPSWSDTANEGLLDSRLLNKAEKRFNPGRLPSLLLPERLCRLRLGS